MVGADARVRKTARKGRRRSFSEGVRRPDTDAARCLARSPTEDDEIYRVKRVQKVLIPRTTLAALR